MKVGDIVINPCVSAMQNGKPNPMHRVMFLRNAGYKDIVCMDFNGKEYNFFDARGWEVVGNIDLKQLMLKGFCEVPNEIVHCKDCQNWKTITIETLNGSTTEAGQCELTKWLCGGQGYCMYGREVEDE